MTVTLLPAQMSEYLVKLEEKKGGEGMWVDTVEVLTVVETMQDGSGCRNNIGKDMINTTLHLILVNCKKRSLSEKAMNALRCMYFPADNIGWLKKHPRFDTSSMRNSCFTIPGVDTPIKTDWGEVVNKCQTSKAHGEIMVHSDYKVCFRFFGV